MKRLTLLILSLLPLFAAAGAQAQEIRVVNPDGTVSVLELPAAPAKPQTSPVFNRVPAPAPAEALKKKPVEKKQAAAKPKAKPPEPAPDLATPAAAEDMGRVIESKPEKKAPAKKSKKKKGKQAKAEAPVKDKKAAAARPPIHAPGQPVTTDVAVRLAIEAGPPARGYDVARRTYKDRPAYQITFKTENGPHDVLIDAETGAVLKR